MKTNELELIVLQLAKKVDEAVSGDIEELLNQVKEDCTT